MDGVLHPSGGVEITVKQAPPPPPPLVRASDVGVSPRLRKRHQASIS